MCGDVMCCDLMWCDVMRSPLFSKVQHHVRFDPVPGGCSLIPCVVKSLSKIQSRSIAFDISRPPRGRVLVAKQSPNGMATTD